jgi:hypothetical protein
LHNFKNNLQLTKVGLIWAGFELDFKKLYALALKVLLSICDEKNYYLLRGVGLCGMFGAVVCGQIGGCRPAPAIPGTHQRSACVHLR